MAMTPGQALKLAQERGARMVDLKFTDVFGLWQHFSVPLRAFDESAFEEGIGFDGSSIRGFQEINESDMLLIPDASTAVMDPFTAEPTLSLVCDVTQPGVARTPYTRDPRYVARKAEAHLKKSGVAISDPLTLQWWGDRTFKVLDPNGYEIWFYTNVAEPAPPQGAKLV